MIGVHIDSNIHNILDEAIKYKNLGCNLLQLFVNPTHNINDNGETKELYDIFRAYVEREKIKIVVHISYTINCAQHWTEQSWWIIQFIREIELAYKLGAFAVIIHLGKLLDLTKEEGINNMFTSLLFVHQKTKQTGIKILIETSTGQGTEMAYKIDDLAYLYRKLSKHKNDEIRERFGICMDTCHVFAAGYDISTKDKAKIFIDLLEETIGLRHIKLIHMNDSKKPLGSHVDRHATIGKGYIGDEALMFIQRFFQKINVPIILETPSRNHEREIVMLL